ncbi:LamG domain-containing protein [Candidatus Poribacteria bacterium]|nr:LamG domain-containing protein [Candidatus Poribacteria bacterium]
MIQTIILQKNNIICVQIFFCILLLLPVLRIDAARDEATVAGNWTFDDGSANDTSKNGINGTFVGDPKSVEGIVGKAFQFNGESDGINLPDTPLINTGGPYPDRTVAAFFKCHDISLNQKQMIFQEGGATRGLCLYVYKGEVYVGGWNRAQYNWEGAWMSESIKSNRWYHVAVVIREGADAVENDKLEMWLDGKLVGKESGGQLYAHTNNTSIGYVTQKTIYHDGVEDLSNVGYFDGILDEVLVYNSAFDKEDFIKIAQPLSIEPEGKFTTTWGYLKDK